MEAVGRLEYAEMPVRLRRWIEQELGSSVTSAVTQNGGFSPGVAARLVTSGGQRAFVKAIAGSRHLPTAALHRYEARAMRSIPPNPMVARLYATYDDGDWIALLFEDIDGRHPDLRTRADCRLVGTAIAELTSICTPSPWPEAQRLEADPRVQTSWWLQAEQLPLWLHDHQDELVALQQRVVPTVHGQTLCQRDVAADNILITADRVVFIDLAWVSLGATWVDTMHLACAAVTAGMPGPDADAVLAGSRHARYVAPEVLTAYLANVAGSAYVKARREDPQNIPALQAFRRSRADALLEWLRSRTGW